MNNNPFIRTQFFLGFVFSCLIMPYGLASSFDELQDNLRFSIDVSARSVNYQDVEQVGYTHIVGMDLHKVFTNRNGDVGTLILQAYMTKLDNQIQHPSFFEDENDSQLVYRIFTFNFTQTQPWQPNLKLGHLEIPYGLEHSINTNGTLRDYAQGSNLGIKADWGVSLNKQHQLFEYEISTSTGGGQSLQANDSSYVYSARIGTPRHLNQIVGISVYESKLANNTRRRVGLDAQHYWGLFALFGQLDHGENNGQYVNRGLMEFNWRDTREFTTIYLQSIYALEDSELAQQNKLTFAIGAQLDYRQRWDFSGQFKWDHDTFNEQKKTERLSLQLRYRF